jgi:hypothetical protein
MTWALATMAALLIGYATVSRRLERLNVSGAMFFTTAGLLVGPVVGLLELQVHSEHGRINHFGSRAQRAAESVAEALAGRLAPDLRRFPLRDR